MTEFWEKVFHEKQEMWWWEPADSALKALELFQKHEWKKILIPGFGYGRNARIFTHSGFEVTGIEISETAVNLAKKHFGESIKIYHGSVNDMPFDDELYDGIFCYALIHLLPEKERTKLINDCYNQLQPDGYMVFISIAQSDSRYGQGKEILKDTFEMPYGVTLFFYDSDSIAREFGQHGLIETTEIDEPTHRAENAPAQKFWYIVCQRRSR